MKRTFDEFRTLTQSAPPMLVSLMILSIVGMNLLANKSIDTGVEWLALDCGILFSWLAFLTMDVLTQCYGPRAASILSVLALAINLGMSLILFIASVIPGVWGESFVEGYEAVINTALDNTFGGTWYVIVGSSVAFIASSILNNFLNHGIGRLIGRQGSFAHFATRAYISTFTAQFADNIIFALLVSRVFFGWSMLQCFTCAVTGAGMELLFEVVFSPLGYRLSKKVMEERSPVSKEDAV